MADHAVQGRVLIIAGSDSSGGAGVQADAKTVMALGGYAMTALTALTAQDTKEIYDVLDVPAEFLRLQIRAALDDIGVDAIKTGMVTNAETISVIAEEIGEIAATVPLVVDPVMRATNGAVLLADGAAGGLKAELVRIATLLTPNIPEAEALSGVAINNQQDMLHAAEMLMSLGPKAVLLKGGHLAGDQLVDVLVSEDGEFLYPGDRIPTRHTHGTGCTLASAVAVGLAQGLALRPAVERARSYLLKAIRTAPGFGAGHGPLNHGHTLSAEG